MGLRGRRSPGSRRGICRWRMRRGCFPGTPEPSQWTGGRALVRNVGRRSKSVRHQDRRMDHLHSEGRPRLQPRGSHRGGRGGALWFGTDGGGVSWYDPKTGAWATFTQKDGLAGNYVLAIAVDERGGSISGEAFIVAPSSSEPLETRLAWEAQGRAPRQGSLPARPLRTGPPRTPRTPAPAARPARPRRGTR